MNSVVKLEHKDINSIAFQEASLDIWDKKYRLTAKDGTPIDASMDDTYKRVARALADVERCLLEGNRIDVLVLKLDHGIHCSDGSLLTARTRRFQRNRTVGAASASAPRTTRYSWWKQ